MATVKYHYCRRYIQSFITCSCFRLTDLLYAVHFHPTVAETTYLLVYFNLTSTIISLDSSYYYFILLCLFLIMRFCIQ